MMRTLTDAALLLGETVSAAELGMLMWRSSDLRRQPRGNGEPVIVLPGFATDDMSTWFLRRYLQSLDYNVCGWNLGLNHGDVPSLIPLVSVMARGCARKAGKRVRLVGWSMGGLIAREIARDEPWLVERVITLGSPIRVPSYPAARHWYSLFGHDLDAIARVTERRNCIPIRVPVTAIRATYDGIVAAEDSCDSSPEVEQIDIGTTHLGLALNPDVYRIIAQRLATLTPRRATIHANEMLTAGKEFGSAWAVIERDSWRRESEPSGLRSAL